MALGTLLVTAATPAVPATADASSRPPWATIIMVGTAAVAFGLIVARWAWWGPDPSTRPSLGQRIGPANWKFGDSWASTLTVFGAVYGAILPGSVLPAEGGYASPPGVALLNLVFGFLVVLAPFVYNATSSRVQPAPGPAGTTSVVSYEGRVATFLVASAVTLWAALGEVATMGLTTAELSPGGTIFYFFAAVLIAVGVLLLGYAWRSIRWILEAQSEHETRSMAAPGMAPAVRPGWTLL